MNPRTKFLLSQAVYGKFMGKMILQLAIALMDCRAKKSLIRHCYWPGYFISKIRRQLPQTIQTFSPPASNFADFFFWTVAVALYWHQCYLPPAIRRMGEGNIFSLFTLGGGVPRPGLDVGEGGTPSQVWGRGVPRPGLDDGGGTPYPGIGYPPGHGIGYSPGPRMGYPLWPPDLGWGTPPDLGRGTPPCPDMGQGTPPQTWDGVPPPDRSA